MLTIFDEGWKVLAIPPRCFVPFESPRTRVPGIGFLTSVPNRVRDAMGSPLLTYLASDISRGGPSWFYYLQPCVCWSAASSFQTTRASGDIVSLLVHTWKLGGCPHSLG